MKKKVLKYGTPKLRRILHSAPILGFLEVQGLAFLMAHRGLLGFMPSTALNILPRSEVLDRPHVNPNPK